MKNKYQEALDVVKQQSVESYEQYWDKYGANAMTILKELVNKETPMKVVKWKLAQPETRCAKCGAGLERYHDYCWGCGQKLDWSDEDEC